MKEYMVPQSLNLVVGKRGNEFLKIEIEVQKNHFKMNLINLSPISIDEVLEDFNSIGWLEKISSLLKNKVQKKCENDYDDTSDIDIVVSHIKSLFEILKKRNRLTNAYEVGNDIDEYEGESIPLVKWLYSFSNRILDSSIMEFVPQIIKKIKEVDIENITIDLTEDLKEKYFLYIGNKKKYKGCVGKLVDTREHSDANSLIEFPGKRDGKTTGRMWCSLENLVLID